jgi:hypothetical protein
LNTSSSAFTKPSHASTATAPLAPVASKSSASQASSVPVDAITAPTQITVSSSVTTGPATATRNSSPAVRVSRSSFATPPNIHRSMPWMPMPLRIATTAWPNSCSSTLVKNSSADTTARANDLPPSPGNMSPYSPDSDQMIRNRTRNQLGSTPMRMPNTRASWIEPPPPNMPSG